MKHFLLTLLIALTATVSSSAQTLQVDPIYIGGSATFEVQNGTPNKTAVICYSLNGSGPFTSGNGITLDLSLPINNLNPFALDALGNGTLGPFPLPASAVVGMQVWFQGVQIDALSNPVYTVTNMVPITVQNIPNNPPTAVDDSASTRENVAVTIDVMANDSDIDGDAISLVSVNIPTNGTAFIVSGQIEYTPGAGYLGADSFTYVIEDIFGAQATATVFVDISIGTLISWGNDTHGQVADTPTTNDFTQVSVGSYYSVALKSDGSLVSWGNDSSGQVSNTPTTNNFVQVSAGASHSVALKSDGSLVSWGNDYHGQVSNTPTTNDFVQVSAGGSHSVALKSDGSLVSWGSDYHGQVTDTPTTNDFTQVSAGASHSVALRTNGTLVSWGFDFYGQVSNTPTTNGFTQVSAGAYHSVALKSDGSLVSWGDDYHNQVTDTPTTNDFVQVAPGGRHSVALKSDGSLVSWGWDFSGQGSDTPTTNDFIQVAAGHDHSVALKQ
jgi:N6-adenosine-specific RNA methylase IME4